MEASVERLEWSGDGHAGSALVLPGASGGIFQAPLYWSSLALADTGWEIFVAKWSARPDQDEVASAAEVGLARLRSGSRRVVIGKSLGSLAAPVVSHAGIPAVWLTPLMGQSAVANAIQSSSSAALVVGGTADETWQRPPARDGLLIVELPSTNHGLLIPKEWRRSLTQLETVVERVLDFAASGHPISD